MSDTNIPPSPADDPVAEETANESPWIMLVTMLLMIAGLLFSSMLLFAQTSEARTADGQPWFQFADLMEKGSSIFSMAGSEERSTNTSSIGQTVANMIPQKIRDRITWPRLEISGTGKGVDDVNYAVINGSMVPQGETIPGEEAKLVEIHSGYVVVELNGQRKDFPVTQED